jgi:hypothetical protein
MGEVMRLLILDDVQPVAKRAPVAPAPAKGEVEEWRFPSSSGAAVYTMKRHPDGSLSCNCPGWIFKRSGQERSCKHTRGALPVFTSATVAPRAAVQPRAPEVVPATLAGMSAPAPMLASAMTTPVTGAAFDRAYSGWLMEEKHDGHRVVVVVRDGTVAAWSRPRAGEAAKRRTLPDQLQAALAHLDNGIYDGELVTPGGQSWDVVRIGGRLVFIAFDALEINGVDMKGWQYLDRRRALLDQLRRLPREQQSVTCTESHPASWARVEAIWARGGEGAILKRPDSGYQPGRRSPQWVKVKESNSAVLTVVGFEAGKMGPFSKVKLIDAHGVACQVKTLDNATRADIARLGERRFLNSRLVISYQTKTPSGSYRHPMFDHWAGPGE